MHTMCAGTIFQQGAQGQKSSFMMYHDTLIFNGNKGEGTCMEMINALIKIQNNFINNFNLMYM